jgi:hypothetical protein
VEEIRDSDEEKKSIKKYSNKKNPTMGYLTQNNNTNAVSKNNNIDY